MPATSLSAEQRARRVRLIIFDVDAVLSDGSIWIFPAPEFILAAKGILEEIIERCIEERNSVPGGPDAKGSV
jgi:hypothetical protein